MRAFLYDARPFSVILADDDQHAADDARRREVRQRIGGDIRADDGLPGHRAAQRVMNRCAEHRGRRRLVAAGLNVHTELREIRLRLDEHIEKMRNGRALITADVRDARLQQRLGDRDDAFAVKRIAAAEPQAVNFLAKRDFQSASPKTAAPRRPTLDRRAER